nr:hypothetical protein [Gammaproteobacteria bacterium]
GALTNIPISLSPTALVKSATVTRPSDSNYSIRFIQNIYFGRDLAFNLNPNHEGYQFTLTRLSGNLIQNYYPGSSASHLSRRLAIVPNNTRGRLRIYAQKGTINFNEIYVTLQGFGTGTINITGLVRSGIYLRHTLVNSVTPTSLRGDATFNFYISAFTNLRPSPTPILREIAHIDINHNAQNVPSPYRMTIEVHF